MTAIKEQAIRLIEKIPDEQVVYIVNILKNIDKLNGSKEDELKKSMEAYQIMWE